MFCNLEYFFKLLSQWPTKLAMEALKPIKRRLYTLWKYNLESHHLPRLDFKWSSKELHLKAKFLIFSSAKKMTELNGSSNWDWQLAAIKLPISTRLKFLNGKISLSRQNSSLVGHISPDLKETLWSLPKMRAVESKTIQKLTWILVFKTSTKTGRNLLTMFFKTTKPQFKGFSTRVWKSSI